MRKVKVLIFLLVISLIILFIFSKYNELKEYVIAQNFDEIVLKYYDDTEFTDMNSYRENGIRRSSDKKKMNKLLNHFKTLKYKRTDEVKLHSLRSDIIDLYLRTDNSGSLKIEVYNERYIVIGLNYIFTIEDKSKRITKIKQNSEYIAYKVVDGNIDMDLIESIYDSMEIEEY